MGARGECAHQLLDLHTGLTGTAGGRQAYLSGGDHRARCRRRRGATIPDVDRNQVRRVGAYPDAGVFDLVIPAPLGGEHIVSEHGISNFGRARTGAGRRAVAGRGGRRALHPPGGQLVQYRLPCRRGEERSGVRRRSRSPAHSPTTPSRQVLTASPTAGEALAPFTPRVTVAV